MSLGKLLLVDDKQENLLALTAVLRDQGYELYEALSGYEALSLAQDHEFIAILLDVQMPVMNGFETAQLIRKREKNVTTPIIFVTAIHRTEAYEQKGYDVGAVDYLFKPVNTEILKAKIAIFSQLYNQKLEIQKQSALLHEKSVKEKENEFLKESLKARDQFLSMAAHELKTPITPLNLQMQTFLKLINDGKFKDIDPTRMERMLRTSYSQVDRLSKMIDALLDVSRFTTGQMQVNFETVQLGELVKRVLQSFEEQLKTVACEAHLEIQSEVSGQWDSFRIEQVFMNLLSNAMKYGAGKPIEISVGEDQGQAVLKVRDHGIGIAKEDQARIFRRFERAVLPEFYGGLGLGLYIAWEIAQLHHGSLSVESEPGRGATFILKLPLQIPN